MAITTTVGAHTTTAEAPRVGRFANRWPGMPTVVKLGTLPDSDAQLLLERIADRLISSGGYELIAELADYHLPLCRQARSCNAQVGPLEG